MKDQRKITHYIALGDSISIDLYPSLDEFGTDHHPAGAASLLAKHLTTGHNSQLQFMNLTQDGARIPEILRDQVNAAKRWHDMKPLITLTAGGNDISFTRLGDKTPVELWRALTLPRIAAEWMALAQTIIRMFPDCILVVNTLYDPTEQTGTFGGADVAGPWEAIADDYSYGRRYLSGAIREFMPMQNTLLADVQGLFKGHGVTANKDEMWYYNRFMIEPGAEGARQISRLWLNTILPLVAPTMFATHKTTVHV